MKHLKKLIPLLALAFLLSACTKDNEARPAAGDYLVSEVWVGDFLQSSWNYDDQNRLSLLTMYEGKTVVTRTHYSYDQRGLLSQAASEFNNGESWVERFEYDGDGRLVRAATEVNGVQQLHHTYAYEKNKATQITRTPEGFESVLTTLLDNRGNRMEMTVQSGAMWTKSVYGDFDDKKTFSYASDWIKTTNNPRYEKTTSSTGVVQEFIYRYTYNEAGYVTSSEKIDKATNGTVEKITFKLIQAK